MKVIQLTFLALWAMGMSSCIFVVSDKKDKEAMSSTDSSNAYSKNDSIQPGRTPVVAVDSSKKDTTVTQLFAGKKIDTKNTDPKQVVDYATTLIGVPYKYASTDPKVGFDCSGFITYVFHHFNIVVPRSSIDFTQVGQEVAADVAKPGDLILFTGTDSTERFVGHMGLIVSNENGQVNFIHSTSGKQKGVTITPLNGYYLGRYMKTIRIFPQNG
jgi:cell wall-associated NlpC family hydrolase